MMTRRFPPSRCRIPRRDTDNPAFARSAPGVANRGLPHPFLRPDASPGSPLAGKTRRSTAEVLPDDWMAVAGPLGVTETIVVGGPSAWLEDNQWRPRPRRPGPTPAGIIGHLEPGTPEFAAHVKRFAAHPLTGHPGQFQRRRRSRRSRGL